MITGTFTATLQYRFSSDNKNIHLVMLFGHFLFTAHAITVNPAPTRNANIKFLYNPLVPYTLSGPTTPNKIAEEKKVVYHQLISESAERELT